jgi:ferredoxin/flavodoxin---NADP+ reductase
MFEIVAAAFIAPGIKRFEVRVPRVATHWASGQFVIVRAVGNGERIPLTVAEVDRDEGTISLIVQEVGKTTRLMNAFEAGDHLADVFGPLGVPSEVEAFGTVVVVGGGVGTAIAYPTARALAEAGNRVIAIIGARTAELVILASEIAVFAEEVIVTTDDGSQGRHGVVTEPLTEVLERERVDRVVAVGPVPMMQAVAEATRPSGVPTVASLNPLMVDGTGMCGGCRVLVDGSTRFACVDGPEFDAHKVDFDLLATRNTTYRVFESEVARPGVCR